MSIGKIKKMGNLNGNHSSSASLRIPSYPFSSYLILLFILLIPFSAFAQTHSVYIDELTWMEVRSRLQSGKTIAIVPTGATEQEGPQLAIGKHNVVARYTAGEIAEKLGNALVTPVIPFAPSGRIYPPEGHMQFAGTISASNLTYQLILEDVARSLKQHGFHMICFIGDNAGSQKIQAQVAQKLTEEWHAEGVRVLNVSNYYFKNGQEEWTENQSIKVANPQGHAGHIDTSELMAVDDSAVRDNLREFHSEHDYKTTGALGDSSVASSASGRKYLSLKIEAAVKQIQNASNHGK